MNKATKAIIKGTAVTAAALGGFGVLYNQLVFTRLSKKASDIGDKLNKKANHAPADEKKNEEKAALKKNSGEWYDTVGRKHVVIHNFENTHLHGFVIEQKEKTNKWAIIVHGYTSAPGGMSDYAMDFYEQGYNVLLPYLRGHGLAETDVITFGWYDRLDMLDWINYIINLNEDAEICLLGVSMGCGTVTMTTGENLPDNVKCCVADCGYTDLWNLMKNELTHTYHLPAFPFLYAASIATKVIDGFSFREVSANEQLKKSKTPTLFIHGEKDGLVPPNMSEINYNTLTCDKEILTVPGAGHAESCRVNPELYWAKVHEFTKNYIND